MAIKRVVIPEIGEVILSKRRGTRNLRLSITAKGLVRVGMPSWTPYTVGIKFAQSRTKWILSHRTNLGDGLLSDGMPIGKFHRLYFKKTQDEKIKTRVYDDRIEISTALSVAQPIVQEKAIAASERALKSEAEKQLPDRLRSLSIKHDLSYKEVKIKKLTSRWGSCSTKKNITLSYYLMQLPWELIDYVLLHELVHTKHMDHSSDFWSKFDEIYPGAKQARKRLKSYQPRLTATPN